MYLPTEFADKMKKLLGEEFEDFRKSYEEPRNFGLRVNTGKISPEEFVRIAPFHLRKIPWVDNGFYYEEQDAPSRHPFYYAAVLPAGTERHDAGIPPACRAGGACA